MGHFGGPSICEKAALGRKTGREFKGLLVSVSHGEPHAYLAEGTGLAERFVATPGGGVERVSMLDADGSHGVGISFTSSRLSGAAAATLSSRVFRSVRTSRWKGCRVLPARAVFSQ